MDDVAALCPQPPRATSARPLLGTTILLVEDSRFASDAMRLLCLHSGARLRRADCLSSARRHLKVYSPTVAIVDLGLPDGAGSELIEDLSRTVPRVPVILGISGDLAGEASAIAAGADGFIAKPLTRLSEFQSVILGHLPSEAHPVGPRVLPDEQVTPDQLALQDDFDHVRTLLKDDPDTPTRTYAAQFLASVAQSAADRPLTEAAHALGAHPDSAHVDQVVQLLTARASERPAF